MGTLFDLLKATAAGQSDTLGRWRRAVSLALDVAAAPQFAYAKGSLAQAAVGNAVTLELETSGATNGIPRDPGSGDGWLLTAGKIYVLRAGGYFDTFSDGATGALEIQWVDDADAPLQTAGAECPTAIYVPVTATGARSNGVALEMWYQPADNVTARVIKLRCTAATGTANKPASSWWASITEIPFGTT